VQHFIKIVNATLLPDKMIKLYQQNQTEFNQIWFDFIDFDEKRYSKQTWNHIFQVKCNGF